VFSTCATHCPVLFRQVAAQAAALRSELSAAQQALAEVREGAAAAEARTARLDAKAAQQQAVCVRTTPDPGLDPKPNQSPARSHLSGCRWLVAVQEQTLCASP